MRTRAPRARLGVVAPFVVAASLTLFATTVAGFEPSAPGPTSIPDPLFEAVSLPSSAPAAAGLEEFDVLLEPSLPALAAERPQPSVREPRPIVVAVKPPAPKFRHSISGAASWYCRAGSSPCTSNYPDGGGFNAYAAAGPGLRAAIGPAWRGTIVNVDGVSVKLIDWCQCYKGQPHEKLLDLYHDVYARTGTSVEIRW